MNVFYIQLKLKTFNQKETQIKSKISIQSNKLIEEMKSEQLLICER